MGDISWWGSLKPADDGGSDSVKDGGSFTFETLPEPTEESKGTMYNVSDAFETDERFVDGEGLSFPAGTNVVVVEKEEGVFGFDVVSGRTDLSDYVTAKQLETALRALVGEDAEVAADTVKGAVTEAVQKSEKYTDDKFAALSTGLDEVREAAKVAKIETGEEG